MKDVAAIDIETTGLTPGIHGIIQIAVVRGQLSDILAGNIGPIKNYKILPVTGCKIDPVAAQINGFSYEAWAAADIKKSFWDIIPELLEDLDGVIPLGWNPAFDKGFIERELADCGAAPNWDYHLIDVSNFALPLLLAGKVESLSMSKVGPYVGVPNTGEHDAVVDVRRALAILPKLWAMQMSMPLDPELCNRTIETRPVPYRRCVLPQGHRGVHAGPACPECGKTQED
jgi:DNA polymerase-3 subunit epsilon